MTDPIVSSNSASSPQSLGDVSGLASAITNEERGGPISGALSLLRDPSVFVRRSSAHYLREHARRISVDTGSLAEIVLRERDEETAVQLIAAVAHFPVGAQRLVSTLVYCAHDVRRPIAIAAAESLGQLGQIARGAFAPMWLSRGLRVGGEGELMSSRFEQALSLDSRRMYLAMGASLDELSAIGTREIGGLLRTTRQRGAVGAAEIPYVGLLYGLCGGSDDLRSEALRLCRKHPGAVHGGDSSLVEPALATAMALLQRPGSSRGLVREFFEACSQIGCAPGLASVLATFAEGDEVDHKLLRDFAVASMLREGDAALPIGSTLEEVWHPDANIVRAAASNLAVLAPWVGAELGATVVRNLFEVLLERIHDSPRVVAALVGSIAMIEGFDREVVSCCSQAISATGDRGTHAAIASVLGKKGYSCEDSRRKATSMLRYLAGSESSLVSETARFYLGNEPGLSS